MPRVYVNCCEHLVDFQRMEFRPASNPLKRIDFDSPAGRRIWESLLILECGRCGRVVVEPRCSSGLRCERCGAWVLV